MCSFCIDDIGVLLSDRIMFLGWMLILVVGLVMFIIMRLLGRLFWCFFFGCSGCIVKFRWFWLGVVFLLDVILVFLVVFMVIVSVVCLFWWMICSGMVVLGLMLVICLGRLFDWLICVLLICRIMLFGCRLVLVVGLLFLIELINVFLGLGSLKELVSDWLIFCIVMFRWLCVILLVDMSCCFIFIVILIGMVNDRFW